jgi:hypothetical protein
MYQTSQGKFDLIQTVGKRYLLTMVSDFYQINNLEAKMRFYSIFENKYSYARKKLKYYFNWHSKLKKSQVQILDSKTTVFLSSSTTILPTLCTSPRSSLSPYH